MEILNIDPTQVRIFLYVVLSMLLGAVVGLERELADKPAGIRTNMLVAGASTLLVSLGDVMITSFDISHSAIRSDPIRIIEAVITGISFIGAGMIIRRGSDKVEGLTSAAAILFVAGIGICVAISQIFLAVATTLVAFLTLRILGNFLDAYKKK